MQTNAVPTEPYRGAGRPEACYCIERTMDAIAHTLSLDPVEVRRRNLIPRMLTLKPKSGVAVQPSVFNPACPML